MGFGLRAGLDRKKKGEISIGKCRCFWKKSLSVVQEWTSKRKRDNQTDKFLNNEPSFQQSRVILDKLRAAQSVEKFPEFYGTLNFVFAFTRASHFPVLWPRSIQYVPFYSISLGCSLILSYHLCIGFPIGSFIQGPQPKPTQLFSPP